MDYVGVPTNLDFMGIPVDLVSEPDKKPLTELFYDCTLLYYVWSLINSEMFEINTSLTATRTNELVERTLYLHNAIGLIISRLTTIYLVLACRFGEDNSIRVSLTNEHECVYIELPQEEPIHPKFHKIQAHIYLPTCYLPSHQDATGLLWINLGGLPIGTRVLVGQTWLTVQ